MPFVSASIEAYGKAFLHAFKFPAHAVSGLLLGKRFQEDGAIFVADAVPLFHAMPISCPNAMLDVALSQSLAVAKTRGLQLVGLYTANELANDNAVSPGSQKVASYMIEKFGMASLIVWQLINNCVTLQTATPAVSQYFISGSSNAMTLSSLSFSRWNTGTCGVDAISSDEALQKVREALESFAHTKLADFDMHLENPQFDYFNEKLAF
jgi:hypothetical protein